MINQQLEQTIFNKSLPFKERAFAVFNYQFEHCAIYKEFCQQLDCEPTSIEELEDIPFLPIELFKSQKITSDERGTETIFRSSGTTGQMTSQHFVADLNLYERSILNGFQQQFGDVEQYCILGLLPSYLERQDASLVHMVDFLMAKSAHPKNGFYLNNLQQLSKTIYQLEEAKQPTLLFGVTFALLDFAEQYPIQMQSTKIVETGGMKGRRKEITRATLHKILQKAFHQNTIFSEYGMTELLSQAYFTDKGNFKPSSTMQVLCRELNDPFHYVEHGTTGALNIIDLANLYSCSFIATQDIGKVYSNGNFDVLGRMDYADVRGCNLMVI